MIRSALAAVANTGLWTASRPVCRLQGATVLKKTCQSTSQRWYSHTSAARENLQRRIQLAAAYRALEFYKYNEGVDNHITALAPAADGSGKEVMLLVPTQVHWSEVTPSCLIGFDYDGNMVENEGEVEVIALDINRACRRKHPHVAVVHVHPPYATALACLEDPTILPLHQINMRFVDKIAYDPNYGGLGVDDEAARLGEDLGDKQVMLMGNHGVLAVGPTVAVAFDRIYSLERVAMFQMIAMATGKPLKHLPMEHLASSIEMYNVGEEMYAQRHLNAFIRKFAKSCSEFDKYDF